MRFGAVLAVALVAELVWALIRGGGAAASGFAGAGVSSVRTIGRSLFTDYAFAFEVTSVLILVVNIGSPEIFTAVTSVAIIMIYIAYLLVTGPMLIKRLRGQYGADAKAAGYFSMGRWGLPVNIVAVVWGALMALNLAWPREDVYGEGLLAWTAFIFIGAVVLIGLAWYRLRGRHHVGTLPEHLAKQLEEAP